LGFTLHVGSPDNPKPLIITWKEDSYLPS